MATDCVRLLSVLLEGTKFGDGKIITDAFGQVMTIAFVMRMAQGGIQVPVFTLLAV